MAEISKEEIVSNWKKATINKFRDSDGPKPYLRELNSFLRSGGTFDVDSLREYLHSTNETSPGRTRFRMSMLRGFWEKGLKQIWPLGSYRDEFGHNAVALGSLRIRIYPTDEDAKKLVDFVAEKEQDSYKKS